MGSTLKTDKLEFCGLTKRGYSIYREDNEVGGSRYWSDEIGGGVMIWDSSLVSVESLEVAIKVEDHILSEIVQGF